MSKATFAAGCFWGVETAFRKVEGVVSTEVGYMGGQLDNPSYEQVCTGRTGHAEVVHLEFDPRRVTYDELLEVFWGLHDPTTPNRQGADIGSQYRSAVFTHGPEQEGATKASKERLQAEGRFGAAIVTEVTPAGPFYRAEDYHQQYFEQRGNRFGRLF